MRLLDSLRFRVATLFRRSELNLEMEAELRSHIQATTLPAPRSPTNSRSVCTDLQDVA